jgi:steroid delta-isomerase-like uncharacterized protein
MPVADNEVLIRRLIQTWNTGVVDDVHELVAPEISVYYPTMPRPMLGIESYRGFVAWMHSTFAELEIIVEELIAGEEKVVARWRQRCVHVGRLLGVPATGKPIEWSGITIFRIQDGKVVDERGEENMLGVMWQLDVLPRPGRKAA